MKWYPEISLRDQNMQKLCTALLIPGIVVFASSLLFGERFPSVQKYFVGDIVYIDDYIDDYVRPFPLRPLRFGDFNGDEVIDICVINDKSLGLVTIRLGDGDGTFNTCVNMDYLLPYMCDCEGIDYAVLDADDDGLDDVIITTDTLILDYIMYKTTESLSWNAYLVDIPATDLNYLIGTCDCNSDGIGDFIGQNTYDPLENNSSFLIFSGTASYPYYELSDEEPHPYCTYPYPIGDFNGDGWMDFIGSSEMGASRMYVFYGSDSCQFSFGQHRYWGLGNGEIDVGDFNGDGCADIVRNDFTAEEFCNVYITYGDSSGLLFDEERGYRWLPGNIGYCSWGYLVVADINCDGLDDVGVVDKNGYDEDDTYCVCFHMSAGDTFLAECDTLVLATERYSCVYSADLNGDGKDDLCYFPSRDTLAVVLNATGTATLLAGFRAYYENVLGVVIEWSVNDTRTCRNFVIRRLLDSEPFTVIGNVEVEEGKLAYSFIDSEVFSETGSSLIYRLDVIEDDGSQRMLAMETVTVPRVAFRLYPNYPNPFNPSTVINFDLPEKAYVWLEIYDVTGRLVRQLISGQRLVPGRYSEFWDGSNDKGEMVCSGIYYCRLKAGKMSSAQKMALFK